MLMLRYNTSNHSKHSLIIQILSFVILQIDSNVRYLLVHQLKICVKLYAYNDSISKLKNGTHGISQDVNVRQIHT